MRLALPCSLPPALLHIAIAFVISGAAADTASAQIVVAPRSPAGTRLPTVQETLINNLRATTFEQQEFVRRVDEAVVEERLSAQLVMAVMRYAQRRYPAYPFPYFERAMRFEASKRDVYLPPVAIIASTTVPRLP